MYIQDLTSGYGKSHIFEFIIKEGEPLRCAPVKLYKEGNAIFICYYDDQDADGIIAEPLYEEDFNTLSSILNGTPCTSTILKSHENRVIVYTLIFSNELSMDFSIYHSDSPSLDCENFVITLGQKDCYCVLGVSVSQKDMVIVGKYEYIQLETHYNENRAACLVVKKVINGALESNDYIFYLVKTQMNFISSYVEIFQETLEQFGKIEKTISDYVEIGIKDDPELFVGTMNAKNCSANLSKILGHLESDSSPVQFEYDKVEIVKMALSNNDIFVVEGACGTGKTTIMRTILNRLMFENTKADICDRNSFNTLDEKKSSELKVSDRKLIHDKVEKHKSKLLKAYINPTPPKYVLDFEDLHEKLFNEAHTFEFAINILEEIKANLTPKLSVSLFQELDTMICELYLMAEYTDKACDRLLKNIRLMPCSRASYDDGGESAILEVLTRLKKQGFDEYFGILQALYEEYDNSENWFERASKLKRQLILAFQPEQRIYIDEREKSSITTLLFKIQDFLYDEIERTFEKDNKVILNYLNEITADSSDITSVITEFFQVDNLSKQQPKGVIEYFGTVLIDCTCMTTNDFFNYLTYAKRVIIFGTKNYSQSGIFEKVCSVLENYEKIDGKKRVVNLSVNYRNHPRFVRFLSRNFFEKYGSKPIISLSKESEIDTGPLEKLFIWYDVPYSAGPEMPKGNDIIRPVEARKIAEHLFRVMKLENCKGLSFGIITLYESQIDVIYDELANTGITKEIEQIKIGTATDLQHMEFDIVYVSLIRSNLLHKPNYTWNESVQKYGNWLNDRILYLSMSRQKKSLILVGDSAMVSDGNAKIFAEPLFNFYNIFAGDENYGSIIK